MHGYGQNLCFSFPEIKQDKDKYFSPQKCMSIYSLHVAQELNEITILMVLKVNHNTTKTDHLDRVLPCLFTSKICHGEPLRVLSSHKLPIKTISHNIHNLHGKETLQPYILCKLATEYMKYRGSMHNYNNAENKIIWRTMMQMYRVSCCVKFLRGGFPFLVLRSIIQCCWAVKLRSLHGNPGLGSCIFCPLHGVLGTFIYAVN